MEEQQNQRNDATTFSIMTCSSVTCNIAKLRMLIFSITACIIAAFNILTLNTHTDIQHNGILLMTFSIATLRMLIFSITAFIIAAFNILILNTHTYIQHNDILHNGI